MIVVPSPSGDASIAINAALRQEASIGGGKVILREGTYAVPAISQITWPANANGVSLVGEGPLATALQFAARSSDAIVITAGNNCGIRDLSLLGDGTGGNLVRVANHHDALFRNIRVDGQFGNAFVVGGGPQQYLCTFELISTLGRGSSSILLGDDASGLAQGVYIHGCKLSQSTYGVYVRNASGVVVSDTELLYHWRGFVTYPAAGMVAKAIQATALVADTCADCGVYLGNGGGEVSWVAFDNSWSASSPTNLSLAPGIGPGYFRGMMPGGRVDDYGAVRFDYSQAITG